MGRRVITKADIDDLADRGERTLEVDVRTTVTDLAVEHARQREVRIVRVDTGPRAGAGAAPASPVEADADDVRAAIRSAVIGRLGEVPAGLDAVIDRVLRSRSG